MRIVIHWSPRAFLSIIKYLLWDHDIQKEAVFTHLRILGRHASDIRRRVTSGYIKRSGAIYNPGCGICSPVRDCLDTCYSFGSVVEHWILRSLWCSRRREAQIPYGGSCIADIGEVVILARLLCRGMNQFGTKLTTLVRIMATNIEGSLVDFVA